MEISIDFPDAVVDQALQAESTLAALVTLDPRTGRRETTLGLLSYGHALRIHRALDADGDETLVLRKTPETTNGPEKTETTARDPSERK